MSSFMSPRRPLANVENTTLNISQSKAESFEGPRKTPSQKTSASKSKKHENKSSTLPKPTLLVFDEGPKNEYAVASISKEKSEKLSASFSGLNLVDGASSDRATEPHAELPSVLKSLSVIVGSSSSEVFEIAKALSDVKSRRALLLSSDGCSLLSQALERAASTDNPKHERDGLFRMVIRLALDGGEADDDNEDKGSDGTFSPDQAVEVLCNAGVVSAVVLHLGDCLAKLEEESLQVVETLSAIALSSAGATILARSSGLFKLIANILEKGIGREATPYAKESAASAVAFLANLAFHEPSALIDSGATALTAACSFLATHPFSSGVGVGISLFQSLMGSGSLIASPAGGNAAAHDSSCSLESDQIAAAKAEAGDVVTCCLAELLRAWASVPVLDKSSAVKKEDATAANDLLARLGYRVDAKVHLYPAAQKGCGIEEAVSVHLEKP